MTSLPTSQSDLDASVSDSESSKANPIQKRKLSDEENLENISIINLELVNKNDKKLIKLNSGLVDKEKQAMSSNVLLAKYDINNSLDSLKHKINQIIKSQEGSSQSPQSSSSCSLSQPQFTFVSLYEDEPDTASALSSSCSESSFNELNRSGSEAGEEERYHRNIKEYKGKKRMQHLICSECGLEFHHLAEFNKHMLYEHGHASPQSSSSSGDSDEMTSSSPTKYKCSMCDRNFSALSSKSRHEREHAGLKPFPCHICSYEFSRMSNLRTHLLRVHPKDKDILYRIGIGANSPDFSDSGNRIVFNLEAIRQRKEEQRLAFQHSSSSYNSHLNNSATNYPPNNTVIYIRDPKNKNGQIQHMVVYLNGKPIFIQNPKNLKSTENELSAKIRIPYAEIMEPYVKPAMATSVDNELTLIENHHHHQQQPASQYGVLNSKQHTQIHPKLMLNGQTGQDTEYFQLVSMFKQKNEKLFNPLN